MMRSTSAANDDELNNQSAAKLESSRRATARLKDQAIEDGMIANSIDEFYDCSTLDENVKHAETLLDHVILEAHALNNSSCKLPPIYNQHHSYFSEQDKDILRDCQSKAILLQRNIKTLMDLQAISESPANQDTRHSIVTSIQNAEKNIRRYNANACKKLIDDYYNRRCQDYKHYDNLAKIGVFFAQCFKPGYQTDRKEIKQFLTHLKNGLEAYTTKGDRSQLTKLIAQGRKDCKSRTSDKHDSSYKFTRQNLFDQIEGIIQLKRSDNSVNYKK